MNKPVKTIVKILIGIVAFIIVALLALPLWIGLVVKPVANGVVPSITGTKFNMGLFALNPYCGRLTVGDTQLYNPTGYSPDLAFTLGRLDVDVDMSTVASDVVVIETLHVKDVFVSYATRDGKSNFDAILEKATGGKKKDDAKSAAPKADVKADAAKPAKEEKKPAEAEKKPAKKVIIDRLCVEGVMAQWGKLSLPLPSVTLTGIGRETQGATWEEVWKKVSEPIMKGFSLVGDGAAQLGALIGDGASAASVKAKDATKAVGNALDSVGTSTKDATKSATKAVGNALDSVGTGAKDATKSATKAVGGALDSTGKALKGLFGN